MIRFLRDLRLVSIAVIASACLLALKTADLVLDRDAPPPADVDAAVIRIAPDVPRPSDPQRSWAQQMFNFPNSNGAPQAPIDLAPLTGIAQSVDRGNAEIITGSVQGNSDDKSETKAKGEAADATGKDGKDGKDGKPANAGKDNPSATPPSGRVIPTDGPPMPSAAERALLERLQERRQELDKRARELDIREGLIAEAEKRMEARLTEIKEAQAQVASAAEKKDEAEAARFKGLVTMYENMKPRDAAKIFDRLNVDVLLEVASQINPRRMSDILAQMSAETAEKLTVELANRAKAVAKGGGAELPKIEGRPTSQ
jgi:flagellar motility protein MotE (MotC chaperone)